MKTGVFCSHFSFTAVLFSRKNACVMIPTANRLFSTSLFVPMKRESTFKFGTEIVQTLAHDKDEL